MHHKVTHLRKVSTMLDSQFQGPFGFRFGWDPILGLIPGVGDLVTTGFSFYILVQAALLNCGPMILLRMGLNVLFENLIGVIPLVGQVFDFFWKSNNKNIEILESYLVAPRATTWYSRILVICVFIFLIALVIAMGMAAVYIFRTVWNFFVLLAN